jgi:hypothetical protein
MPRRGPCLLLIAVAAIGCVGSCARVLPRPRAVVVSNLVES